MNSSNAQTSGGNAGENQPQISVVPPEKTRRVTHQPLTKAQRVSVDGVSLIAQAAQQAPYKDALERNGITAAFLTMLLADIKAVTDVAQVASGHSSNSQVATREGESAKKTLVADLRQIQDSGRQLHQHTTPEKLQDYLIGEDIAANRATLKSSAETLLNKTQEERGPGIDTDFVNKTTGDLAAFTGKNATQENESVTAQNMRKERDAKVNSIADRGITLKTAANRAWPYANPDNAGPRRKFKLPEKRPYAPPVK